MENSVAKLLQSSLAAMMDESFDNQRFSSGIQVDLEVQKGMTVVVSGLIILIVTIN